MTRRFKPPIFSSAKSGGEPGEREWTLNIDEDEQALVARLLAELRGLLQSDDDTAAASPLLQRLFPTTYPDDAEKEAEYQRLMREELVASRLHQISAVSKVLEADDSKLDEGQTIAFMQSINAVRVVLGTVLDVSEDDEIGISSDEDGDDDDEYEGERQLYGYLSWLLEWTVRSLQP